MKVFTYSRTWQALATVLDTARSEPVIIKRRGGDTFVVTHQRSPKPPFNVSGIRTKAAANDILPAIRESRSRGAE